MGGKGKGGGGYPWWQHIKSKGGGKGKGGDEVRDGEPALPQLSSDLAPDLVRF